MKRILIPYAIVGTIFWVRVDIFHRLAGFARLLKDYFYITFFTEGINNLWFVFFIGTMYLMFPLFYACIFRKNTGPILFVLLLAAAIMIPVAVQKNDPDLYHNINIAITRVPIFIIGIAAGKPIKEGKTFPHMAVIALVAVCFLCKYYAVIHDFKRYMFRYSSCIFAMGIMIICVYLLRLLDGAGLFRKILCFFGNNSLEFYLLHILMWELFAEAGIPLYKASRYAVMMCVCIILAPVLNRITGVISRALSAAK